MPTPKTSTAASPQDEPAAEAQESRLLAWARSLGLLDASAPPLSDATPLLGYLGERIEMYQLGDLVMARLAERILEAKSGTELASLLRVLEKLPDFVTRPEPAALAQPSYSAGLPELDFEQAVAEARRLLAEVDAEAAQS